MAGARSGRSPVRRPRAVRRGPRRSARSRVVAAIVLLQSSPRRPRYRALGAVSGSRVGDWPGTDEFSDWASTSVVPLLRVVLRGTAVLAVAPAPRPAAGAGAGGCSCSASSGRSCEAATPSATLAAFLVALVAATSSASPSARPPATRDADIAAALRSARGPVERLEAADRQPAGVYVARGWRTRDGSSSSRCTGATRTTRTCSRSCGGRSRTRARARDCASAGSSRRARGAHHASRTSGRRDDARGRRRGRVLGGRDPRPARRPRPLGELPPDGVADESSLGLAGARAAPRGAHRAPRHRSGHRGRDPGGRRGARRVDRATVAPRPDQLLTDRAQLLATTDGSRGRSGRRRGGGALGPDGVVALLPYLQPAALGTRLRRRSRPPGSTRTTCAPWPPSESARAAGAPPPPAGDVVDARPAGAARARRVDGRRRSRRARLRGALQSVLRTPPGAGSRRLRRRAAAAPDAGDLDARLGRGAPALRYRST